MGPEQMRFLDQTDLDLGTSRANPSQAITMKV